ncbi:MAG: sigma-70 family RNA polymerase sigma factor, partial [Myxococcales bacterium]|nr:sigma-70 family RNA polymerase sigma factor [Myxococcales bacterium]
PNDAEAEEAMQEAYLRAYRRLHQFENRARFSTWLTKIALHEALARRRRSWRFVSLDGDAKTPPPGAAPRAEGPTPEEEAAHHELRSALESAIARLPQTYRTVFVLRHIEGLSTTETAACLDISAEAVKSRLFRSRKLLQPSLELFRRQGRVHEFLGSRCDRLVSQVLRRL